MARNFEQHAKCRVFVYQSSVDRNTEGMGELGTPPLGRRCLDCVSSLVMAPRKLAFKKLWGKANPCAPHHQNPDEHPLVEAVDKVKLPSVDNQNKSTKSLLPLFG